MDVFELAASATVVQAAIWLLLVVIKTLTRMWRMVWESKRKPGAHSKDRRVK